LDMARVRQEDLGQVHRGFRAVDRPSEALLHQDRKESAVVQVSVGKDDRVQRSNIEGEGLPISCLRPTDDGNPSRYPRLLERTGASIDSGLG
jgi:hypothetical protein